MKAVLIFFVVLIAAVGGTVAYRVLDKPAEVAQNPVTTATTSKPEGEQKLKQGSFVNVDSFHKGSGQAVIYKAGDTAVLKFEDFTVVDGPDLYVYLSKNANIEQDKKNGEFVSLGKLQKTNGPQTYNLPPDYEDYRGVSVYCRAFAQPFTVAALL